MQGQDDKEVEAMLAAFLDGELADDESRALSRRIEAGDTRLGEQLEELKAVREETRKWFADLSREAASVDIWPGLEARIQAEFREQQNLQQQSLQKTSWGWAFKSGKSRAAERGERSVPGFGRGFSWGFVGGFTAAGCAVAMAMMLVKQESSDRMMVAGRQMMPLMSAASGEASSTNIASLGISGAVGATGSSIPGMVGSGMTGGTELASADTASSLANASSAAGSMVRVARDSASDRQEAPLAFVSAGRETNGLDEFALNGPVYELRADLFAAQQVREFERERQMFSDALSVQLLSPSHIAPSNLQDFEMLARRAPGEPEAMASLSARRTTPSGITGASGYSAGFGDASGYNGPSGSTGNSPNSPADVTWVSQSGVSRELH